MILRLVLCFCFLCFVHCDSLGINTEDNKAQLKINESNAEILSKAEPQLVGHELRKGDNSTKTLSSSKEHKRDEIESVAAAVREVARNDDQSKNNEDSERRTNETPETLVKGDPHKIFESNGEECLSPLSMKNIVKNVLEYVKKHPDALDLIINEIKSESEEKAESSEIQNDPTHHELRSLPKSLIQHKLFDTNNGCPRSIARFLKKIPKFLSQLRKHPQCLFPIFGCNEFKVYSTSSHFCKSLNIILNVYEIPRPESRPIHEFVSPTPEFSFETIEPEFQIPFYLQELNESQSEPGVKPYYIVPQYSAQEQPTFSKYIPNEIITTPEFTPQFEVLSQEQIRPQQEAIQTDVTESPSFYIPVNTQPDIFDTEVHKANIEEDIQTYVQEPIYDRYPKPIHIEDTEPAYVENFEPFYIDESKPVNKHFFIKKPELIHFEEPVYVKEPTYSEEYEPIYIEQPESIYIEASRPIYPEEPEPVYVKDFKHKIKSINIKKPKPFYVEQPKSEVEPIYIAETDPVYAEEPKPISEEKLKPVTPIPIYVNKPKSIAVQEPEFTYIEESKPHIESIYNEKLKKDYFQDTRPLYIEKPKLINPEESKPVIEPIYTEESRPIYEEKPEPIYVEELKPGINPMVINEPAPVYVDKLNPMSDHKSNHQKPIHIYNKEPKPIAIQEPEPIYIDERESVTKPNYLEEHKPIYNQYPAYFEETTPNYEIESSPTHEEDFNLDGVKEKPKPIHVKHPELIYVKELKPGNKPIVIDEPAPIYIKEPQTNSIQEPESMYIEERGPVNNPIYLKKPKSIYNQYPVYFEESTANYEIISSPIYEEDFNLDDVKEKPKPNYIEHPELIYVDELKPGNKPIVIDEPTPVYGEKPNPISVNESKYQKPVPSHVKEPKPIAIQELEPIYIDEREPVTKPNYFEEPKPFYNQSPEYFEESSPNYEMEASPTYVEALNPDDFKERPKPIYVEHPEFVYTEELKPGNKPIVIDEPAPVYVEKLNPMYGHESNHQTPIHINNKEPKPIAIQEPEPVYIDERESVTKPNYFKESKPTYNQYPEYFEEMSPNYEIESSPTYVGALNPYDVKERPKPIYVEHPELVYTEELKPSNKPIVIDEPAPVYVEKLNPIFVDESKDQKPVPFHIREPKPIAIQNLDPIYNDERGPIHKPNYFKESNPIYNQYPEYFEETSPNYEIESSPTYVEAVNPDDVKETPKPIYVEHPELIYTEELTPGNKPIVIDEPAPVYTEKLKLISVDESKYQKPVPSHVKEPKPIAMQKPEPIYIDKSGPVTKPNYFEKPKPFYNQSPEYFEESSPNYEIESSPTYVEALNPDDVKERPKPIYVEHPELVYTEELKPGNKNIVIDKPAPVYVEKLNPIFVDESKHQKPVPFHIREPKPIAIQEPDPIYVDERGPVHKPKYFKESKPIYNQYPEYFEETSPNYEIESTPTYVESLNPDDVKETPKPIYVEHPELIYTEESQPRIEPIYLNEPKVIYVEDDKTKIFEKVVPVEIPDFIDSSEPAYENHKQNPTIEIQPVYVEDTVSTHEKEYSNKEPRTMIVEKPESYYIDQPIFVENPKRIPTNNKESVSVEAPENIYSDEIKPEPMYVEKENDYLEYPEADIYFEQSIPESISKSQSIHVEESTPVYEKETTVDLKLDSFKVKPKPVVVAQLEPMYMEEPRFEEFNTYFEKPKHIYFQEQETIYPEESELFSNDQLTHVEDSKPFYVEAPEITYIKKPISKEQIEAIHRPQKPKEQPAQQIYTQILPSNVVEQIIQLIRDNPKKHVNNIMKVLQENQQVIKPQLYKALFSVLNALITGIVDSERFNEIVNYLIKPRINSEWNNKKTQALHYLLLPGRTGQVEVSALDVIYGLIHQPKNTCNNPQMLDLIFPLLKKIKTGHVDHRINDIILALLNRNKNNIFSDKEVEILLTFIQPNKMGYIPKQRIDIASMLVSFDKIPYFSQNNIKTIFLLMVKNKTGRIDPRAIQILKEILLPKKLSFLSEQNIIDILKILRTDSEEFLHPKRLKVVLFLLKNKPQAPNLIDCLIKSLKDYDIFHSKFIDIILYLHKKKMLAYNLLETLVSLLSQENSGHIDPRTLNSFLLLLAPYKDSKPKVVFDVYHILNRETFSTPNVGMSKTHHNIEVLMSYLMNSGTKQFDQSLNQGYNQVELKNLFLKVFQKPEWSQSNEFVPESLEHDKDNIELTYLLKDHEPLFYHPVYYVKYNIPMTIFLRNIQDILARDSELINDPPKLLQELTLAGSVSEVSSNLNGFQKEDILKLTFEDGKLMQTKVLDEKNLNLNDQIKQLQDFNSNTSPQEILQQNNINAAKYYITYKGKPPNLAGRGSVTQGGNIGSINSQRPVVMSLKKNYLREIKTDEPKRTNNSLPLNDQRISTQSMLIGLEDVNDKNETERHQ